MGGISTISTGCRISSINRMTPKPRKCHAAEKKPVLLTCYAQNHLKKLWIQKSPWRFITGHHVDLETSLDPRKFGLDYDIYAGLRTLGYSTVLTKADLVLMTTTEDARVEMVFRDRNSDKPTGALRNMQIDWHHDVLTSWLFAAFFSCPRITLGPW